MDEFTKAINETQNEDFVGGDVQDNAIEFLRGAKTAVATFSQGRYISKMQKYKEQHPDEVEITPVHNSNAIVCKFPVSWVKVSPPRHISDEQREKSAERFRQIRERKNSTSES